MTDREEIPPPGDEWITRDILLGTARGLRFGRRFFRHLPSAPRCKLCASPFRGAGGVLMRHVGKAPWPKNPKYCSACWKEINEHRGGAEIECSLVFADVRDSTTLAEVLRPAEFRDLMNRFFDIASRVIVEHDGMVDKYVGDEVVGIFIPGLTGDAHARQAIDGATELLAAVARKTDLRVGAGVNTDVAFVGTVGEGINVELTAMGDAVNVTARLASAAGAGEVLVTTAAARAARLDVATLERRRLDLKGKTELVDVVVVRP